MARTWNKGLSTGLYWQDEEHRGLFASIDDLWKAMRRNAARTHLETLFAFLDTYVIEHFGHEEHVMTESGDSDLMEHSLQHAVFRRNLKEIQATYAKQGGSSFVVMRVQRLLADWLIKHVAEIDKTMAKRVLGRADIERT